MKILLNLILYFFVHMILNNWLKRIILLQEKYIDHKRLILILSILIGILSGLAAVLLKNLVHFTKSFLSAQLKIETASIFYFALPLLGILLTVLFVNYFIKEDISHGVTRVLSAISKKGSILKLHNLYSSLIGSTLTVGFGGSVGLEAPIVLTGSSIGSNLGRAFRLDYKTITLLIGCGAAGAIAGIFKAPIAAIIFCLEVLMLDLTLWSIVPLLISATTATVVAYFLLGKGAEFSFALHHPFEMKNLPYYIVLGLGCGLVSFYFTKASLYTERIISGFKGQYKRIIIGGLILGVMIYILPPLFGEGYDVLKNILSGHAVRLADHSFFYDLKENKLMFLAYLLLIVICKVVAMTLTTGSGGVGGLFAPSLFTGGIFGFIVASLANYSGILNLPEDNFSLAGMAGVMAGVMHSPLTAVFLIAEVTNGYDLFVPLILTSSVAYITARYFAPHSLYHIRLALKGELITHHKDKTILTLMKLESVIEKDLEVIGPDASLGELVKLVSLSHRNVFPVVDEKAMFMGVILLDDIRDIMFHSEQYETVTVLSLLSIPPAFVEPEENMDSVMNKFEATKAWNLPVIDNGKYVGFISKSKIFNSYRKLLMDVSQE
jgi:chloride channel protein, CIC family